MKFRSVIAIVLTLCLFLVSCITVESTPTPITDPCFRARIITPKVAESKSLANSAPVSNEIEIAWAPAGCVMTVQSYQNMQPDPIRYYENVSSGTTLELGEIGRAHV